MRPPVPPHLSRPLALGILALLLALVGLFVVMPLVGSYSDGSASLAENRALIERYRQQTARETALEDKLAALSDLQLRSGFYLSGETEAVAAAALQDRFRALAAQSGAEVKSIQSLPPKTEEGLSRVGVRVALAADSESFYRLLHDLEGGSPYIFVENLELQLQRKSGGLGKIDETGKLSLRLDLFGFRQPEVS
ncbi:MAG TPA: type II secretion system protein GspM [Kiloniellaceae bacterium]|nr:type II secretion system protein GspM [Kiloniellaceae bacterium]